MDADDDRHQENNRTPMDWLIVSILAVSGALLGGYLAGCAVSRFGSFGAISIWGLGAFLGWCATKTIQPARPFGWILAIAVVLAFLVAEICWIRWNIIGVESWAAAIEKLPRFFREYQLDALVGGLMTFFGASAAFRQAAHRYEYVRVLKR